MDLFYIICSFSFFTPSPIATCNYIYSCNIFFFLSPALYPRSVASVQQKLINRDAVVKRRTVFWYCLSLPLSEYYRWSVTILFLFEQQPGGNVVLEVCSATGAERGGLRGWERRTEEIRSTEKFLLMFPLKLSLCLGNGTIPQAVWIENIVDNSSQHQRRAMCGSYCESNNRCTHSVHTAWCDW